MPNKTDQKGDPWDKLPNLSGLTSTSEQGSQYQDPGRFYSASRGGQTDAVSERVQNMPRCKVNLLGQIPMVAPNNAEVPWAGTLAQSVVYDTDGMLVASPNITIKTPGVYLCSALCVFSGGGVSPLGTEMLLIYNNSTAGTNWIGASAVQGNPAAWGTYCSFSMPWPMNAGDHISMWVSVAANVNFTVPWMAACMISSFGSDNQ